MSGTRRRIGRDVPMLLAAGLLVAITLVAAAALLRPPSDPALRVAAVLDPPSLMQPFLPFGADAIGRDLFARVLVGMARLWLPSVAVVAVAAGFGSLIGAVGGSAGGWVDALLHRLTGLFRAIPAAIAAIAAAAVLGGPYTAAVALTLFWWPWYARLVRAEMRRQRHLPHVEAARLSGLSPVRRVWRHMLPAAVPGILVTATLDLAHVTLVQALVSFLGLGSPDPAPDLGAMTAQALDWLTSAWWLAGAPVGAVFALALAANIAGEVFRARLDRQ